MWQPKHFPTNGIFKPPIINTLFYSSEKNSTFLEVTKQMDYLITVTATAHVNPLSCKKITPKSKQLLSTFQLNYNPQLLYTPL